MISRVAARLRAECGGCSCGRCCGGADRSSTTTSSPLDDPSQPEGDRLRLRCLLGAASLDVEFGETEYGESGTAWR